MEPTKDTVRQEQFGPQEVVKGVRSGDWSEVESVVRCLVKYDILLRLEKRLDIEEGSVGEFDHYCIRVGRCTWRKLSTVTSIVPMRLLEAKTVTDQVGVVSWHAPTFVSDAEKGLRNISEGIEADAEITRAGWFLGA